MGICMCIWPSYRDHDDSDVTAMPMARCEDAFLAITSPELGTLKCEVRRMVRRMVRRIRRGATERSEISFADEIKAKPIFRRVSEMAPNQEYQTNLRKTSTSAL